MPFNPLRLAGRTATGSNPAGRAARGLGKKLMHGISDALGCKTSDLQRALAALVTTYAVSSTVKSLQAIFYNTTDSAALSNSGLTLVIPKGASKAIRPDSTIYGRFLSCVHDGETYRGVRCSTAWVLGATASDAGMLRISVAGVLSDGQAVEEIVRVGEDVVIPLDRICGSDLIFTVYNLTDATNGADVQLALSAQAILDDDGSLATSDYRRRVGLEEDDDEGFGKSPFAKTLDFAKGLAGVEDDGESVADAMEGAIAAETVSASQNKRPPSIGNVLRKAAAAVDSKMANKAVSSLKSILGKKKKNKADAAIVAAVEEDDGSPALSTSSAPRLQSRNSTFSL